MLEFLYGKFSALSERYATHLLQILRRGLLFDGRFLLQERDAERGESLLVQILLFIGSDFEGRVEDFVDDHHLD